MQGAAWWSWWCLSCECWVHPHVGAPAPLNMRNGPPEDVGDPMRGDERVVELLVGRLAQPPQGKTEVRRHVRECTSSGEGCRLRGALMSDASGLRRLVGVVVYNDLRALLGILRKGARSVSQQVRIVGVRVTSPVFLGEVLDPTVGTRAPVWSADADRVMGWLCDGFRWRFNDRRAWRGRYAYADGERVLDSSGEPFLVPLGLNPEWTTNKQVREQHSFLAALPDRVLQAPDRLEAEEWFSASKRRATLSGKGRRPGGMPMFRRKADDQRFACWFNNGRNATFTKTGRRSGVVTIYGMNPVAFRGGFKAKWAIGIRVRISQDIRDYTSIRVNWTRRELVFVNQPAAVTKKEATGAAVGLDLGVKRTVATSDGEFFDQPSTADLDAKIKYHQRRMAKSRHVNNPLNAKGWTATRRYTLHRDALGAAHAAKARRLEDWRQQVTTALAREHDLIAIEALDVRSMTKSARGTLDAPGVNVHQKAGLNRSLAQAGFATLRSMLTYKTEALIRAGFDQHLLAVPPKNTSRRCNKCGHTSKENRKSQAVFSCLQCGYTANADTNASSNVLDAALTTWGWADTRLIVSQAAEPPVVPAGSKGKTEASEEVPASVLDGTCDEPQTISAA